MAKVDFDNLFNGLALWGVAPLDEPHLEAFARRHGGTYARWPAAPQVEIDRRPLDELAGRLVTAEIDLIVFLTGWGAKLFAQAMRASIPASRLAGAFAEMHVVAGSLLAARELEESGARVLHSVECHADWKALLKCLERDFSLPNMTIAVETGYNWRETQAGLEARGARAWPIPVFGVRLAERQLRARPTGGVSTEGAVRPVFVFELPGLLGLAEWLAAAPDRNVDGNLLLLLRDPWLAEVAAELGLPFRLFDAAEKVSDWGGAEALEIAKHLW